MSTTFWIEANENGTPKKVPHHGKKNCEFLNSGNAREFLQQLRTNNPETKFRMVTCKSQITAGPWTERLETQLRNKSDG
jgi:hypothetical protein